MVVRTVLVVDDDAAVRDALAQTLELGGLVPRVAGSFVEAKDQIGPGFPGVILSDIRMPGRDGFHLLDYARAADPDLPVILLTGEGDIPMAVKAKNITAATMPARTRMRARAVSNWASTRAANVSRSCASCVLACRVRISCSDSSTCAAMSAMRS